MHLNYNCTRCIIPDWHTYASCLLTWSIRDPVYVCVHPPTSRVACTGRGQLTPAAAQGSRNVTTESGHIGERTAHYFLLCVGVSKKKWKHPLRAHSNERRLLVYLLYIHCILLVYLVYIHCILHILHVVVNMARYFSRELIVFIIINYYKLLNYYYYHLAVVRMWHDYTVFNICN